MERLRAYWRQFEESVIVFANRFRNNLLLKTQVTFVGALFLICVVNIVSLSLITNAVAEDTLTAVFSRWGSALVEGVPSPAFTVLELEEQVEAIEQRHLMAVGAATVLAILLLGITTSKVALEPTRDAIGAQRNFIAHTAHELRTPLSIARTNIEVTLLDTMSISKETCVEELRRTLTELDALAGIINNLVMLNSVTNFEPAEYHYHDLDEVVREVAQSYHLFAESKSIALTIESTPGLLVWSNRNALKQMLGNLLGNAINFTPENGNVTMHAFQFSARHIRFTVSDTGIGIAKEELPFIFKPFYRSPAVQDRHEGSGLGLAIVRELVRLHFGRIKVHSVLNEGTTVTIDLPIFKRRGLLFSKDRKNEAVNMVSFNYSSNKRTEEF